MARLEGVRERAKPCSLVVLAAQNWFKAKYERISKYWVNDKQCAYSIFMRKTVIF